MIDNYHLNDNIYFCGPTYDVQNEMLNSAFLGIPSRSEGFGMVLYRSNGLWSSLYFV